MMWHDDKVKDANVKCKINIPAKIHQMFHEANQNI